MGNWFQLLQESLTKYLHSQESTAKKKLEHIAGKTIKKKFQGRGGPIYSTLVQTNQKIQTAYIFKPP